MMRFQPLVIVLAGTLLITGGVAAPVQLLAQRANPASAAAELLAADRAFSAASARTNMISGIGAIFAADVIIPGPGSTFSEGKTAALALLRRDTLAATSRASWTPVRAGISGDGTHGFTIGFIDVVRADGSHAPGQYLAYWIKGTEGWRVAVYRRARRASGLVDSAFAGFVLPDAGAPARRPSAARTDTARTDTARTEADRASLVRAESNFSDLATEIGLGPAFERMGDPLATHLSGGPNAPDLARGNVAIAASVSEGLAPGTNPYTWATDFRAIVAPSGDLAVSIGYIHLKERAPDGSERPTFPFFTVWRRAGPGAPWRYIAE